MAMLVTACGGGDGPGSDAGLDAHTAFSCEELATLPQGTPCDQPAACVTCGGAGCGIDCYDGRITMLCLSCDAGVGSDAAD